MKTLVELARSCDGDGERVSAALMPTGWDRAGMSAARRLIEGSLRP